MCAPTLRRSIERYDQIPDSLFQGELLEIGARYGEGQLASRHRERFIEKSRDGSYWGIDLLLRQSPLRIIQMDFLEMKTTKRFDTVLAIEVLEHISLCHWSRFIHKMVDMLRPSGHLFLTMPFNESTNSVIEQLNHCGDKPFDGHVTYGITPRLIEVWLQGATFKRKRHRVYWREDGESLLWAIGRAIKRIVTGHPHAWGWTGLTSSSLIVHWQKEEREQ
jgi:hypothetical protein